VLETVVVGTMPFSLAALAGKSMPFILRIFVFSSAFQFERPYVEFNPPPLMETGTLRLRAP